MSNNNNFYNELTALPVTKLEIMEIEELHKAYILSRKHNRRSSDQVRFERNLYGNLLALCDAINRREYRPVSNYAFIHYRNKAREVFAAEVEMKIIQAYIIMRLGNMIEDELTPCTFNNRNGMGTYAAINKVMCDMNEESMVSDDVWVIKWDLKGYFPNINQDISYNKIMAILDRYKGDDKEDLQYLIMQTVYCNPQFNSKRVSQLWEWNYIAPYKSLFSKRHGIGAAIGFLFWQIMSNLYLNDIDKYITENICEQYTRFVDDCVCVTDDKEKVLQFFQDLRTMYGTIGVTMHPHKFYCQQVSKGLEFLGYHLHKDRLHLNRKIYVRANNLISKRIPNLQHALCALNSYAGMMKMANDKPLLMKYFSTIHDKRLKIDYINLKICA